MPKSVVYKNIHIHISFRVKDVRATELKNDCACVTYVRSSAGPRLEQQISKCKINRRKVALFFYFYMTLRVFPFQNALFICVGLR